MRAWVRTRVRACVRACVGVCRRACVRAYVRFIYACTHIMQEVLDVHAHACVRGEHVRASERRCW